MPSGLTSSGPLPKTFSSRSELVGRKLGQLQVGCRSFFDGSRPPPGIEVDATHHNAEDIRRYEAQLVRSESNNAYDDAIDGSQCPAFPAAASDQNGGRNR